MQVCLGHLKSAGVDLTAIDAEGKRLNVSSKKKGMQISISQFETFTEDFFFLILSLELEFLAGFHMYIDINILHCK